MSTTLPLFWHLSSASKQERIDASVKLIGALEQFQAQFVPKESSEPTTEDEEDQEAAKGDGLNSLNSQDVSYSIRRLVRGLASPRESSRLGFAVALTELLSRIDTVTCTQVVSLILDSAKTQGSMTGQEERDALFARLFGLTAVIQSGLLIRIAPLSMSASSTPAASSLDGFKIMLSELLVLGEKKSWLRESAWWTIGLAVDALATSEVSWKADASEFLLDSLFLESKNWTPEKVALALKLQKMYPSQNWRKLLLPTFKNIDITSTANYSTLARILKDLDVDDEDDADVSKSNKGSWKPQVHFVWDMLLDDVLPDLTSEVTPKGSFPEFFRILVDESLFSSTSSPERKYWGFQIFQKALPRVREADLPMLFTKNFMRSWINHLSNSDRYLHKIAKQVVNDIQTLVQKNPRIGFALILQLTGVHGSHQFDKLTKTKTVEKILASMDNDGIQSYIQYLVHQVNDEQGTKGTDFYAIAARRTWVIDQLAALIRNGAIPKKDEWVQAVLDWFVAHGLFVAKKKSESSDLLALHTVPSPAFSEELRKTCREKLLSCLAELTGQSSLVKTGERTIKVAAVASDNQFWVSKVLSTVSRLEKDNKHVSALSDIDEEGKTLRQKAHHLIERLSKVSGEQQEAAKGAELLLSAILLHQYCLGDDEEADVEALENCIEGASRMFPVESKKSKKSRKSVADEDTEDAPEPVDVLVDTVIGFLEQATAYMRAVANQVFSLLSGSVHESTVDLILTQLERRDPEELAEDEDEEMEAENNGNEIEGETDSSSEASDDDDDDEDSDEAEDSELRRKIEEALSINGIQAATSEADDDSEEELMDDDQMMAIDEQLAAVFRARADEKRQIKGVDAQREATHYKNRVLDLLDIFIKKQPTSPLVTRIVLPLADLITSTGSDEKQLADKATGLLRSRIGKSKDIATITNQDQAVEVLEELHTRARRAQSSEVLTTLDQCSLYLSKALLHIGAEQAVTKAYRDSSVDFITRKASRLNSGFFQSLIRRHPSVAWNMRDDLITITSKAVNPYRQTQAFQLLHTLVNQLPALGDRSTEILQFMPALRQAIQRCIAGACGESATLTVPQMREVFKLALLGVRQTRRISSTEDVIKIWDPPSWDALSSQLAAHDRFKSSMALQTMCRQVSQTANQGQNTSKQKSGEKPTKDTAARKRKVDTLEEDGEGGISKKERHRKTKKAKA